MFCKKCGAELKDGSMFCSKCGSPVSNEDNAAFAGATGSDNAEGEYAYNAEGEYADQQFSDMGNPMPPKKNGFNNLKAIPKKTLIIAGVAVVAVVVILIVVLSGRPTIDLNEYVTFEASGYDGYGTVDVDFDEDAFIADNSDKIKLSDEYSTNIGILDEFVSQAAAYTAASYLFNGDLDMDSGLYNGDVVTYVWDIDETLVSEMFNCDFQFSNIEYTVSGLLELGEFDAFDGVSVVFSGTAPFGSASLEISSDDEKISYSYYELSSNSDELSNGDSVEVTWTGSEDDFAYYYGMVPAETTKTYTVEGLPSYVTSIDEIPDELMESMLSQSDDVLRAYIAGWDDEVSLSELTYIGDYFLFEKSYSGWSTVSYYYQVYRVDAEIDLDEYGVYDYTFYTFVRYDTLTLLPDGTGSVDLSGYSRCSNYFYTEDYQTGQYSWSTTRFRFEGYSDLDSLFNNCVTSNIDSYTYESTVEDTTD